MLKSVPDRFYTEMSTWTMMLKFANSSIANFLFCYGSAVVISCSTSEEN